MNKTYSDSRVAVYDDLLQIPERDSILRYLDTSRFWKLIPDSWGRAFRLDDGDPLAGLEITTDSSRAKAPSLVYPTGSPLDLMVRAVLSIKPQIEDVVGLYGDSWSDLTACPYVYPAQSGLSWHSDYHCTGAFIYYAHSLWDMHWGGELLVADVEMDCAQSPVTSRGIFKNRQLEEAIKNGFGRYFAPLPNRIIVLKGATPHTIKKVNASAGDNLRISIAGFFHKRSLPVIKTEQLSRADGNA